MMRNASERELQQRADRLRELILDTVFRAGSGHIGGSLSAAEILTVLYGWEMQLRPDEPAWAERDRFVLSKGHATPAYYGALAQSGFFPMEWLNEFRKLDGRLQGHPDRKRVPGVDMSTGSLGQGVSAAVGMALAAKLRGQKHRVYALLGDGELQEGQVWEAMMLAAHRRLDNLCVIIDYNGVQSDGRIEAVNSPEPIDRKLEAFNLRVIEADGHSVRALMRAFEEARGTSGRPAAILAHTIKGKGVPFMEGKAEWHGKVPNAEEYAAAKAALAKAGESA